MNMPQDVREALDILCEFARQAGQLPVWAAAEMMQAWLDAQPAAAEQWQPIDDGFIDGEFAMTMENGAVTRLVRQGGRYTLALGTHVRLCRKVEVAE